MPRRYTRGELDGDELWNVPVPDFPTGEGPPLFLTTTVPGWTRLPPSLGGLVSFDAPATGAFADGLVKTNAVIWIHQPVQGGGAAYCYHAPQGPLDPSVHTRTLDLLGLGNTLSNQLFVVIASRGVVEERMERFFVDRGVGSNNVFAYSNAFLPQFGVSGKGCVGEPR